QGTYSLFTAPSGGVNFGEIQVLLCLIPLHPNGGVAQPFRFAPLAFRARQHHSEVRHVIGIVLVQIHRAPHVRQRLHRIIVPQQSQSSFEFTEGFRIHHRLTSSTPTTSGLQENWNSGRLGRTRAARSRIAPTSFSEHPDELSCSARR